jgi:fucose permease
LIAEVFAALNLLNVFFGLGAFAGPALAGLSLRLWATAMPALWLGAGLLLVQVAFVPLLTVPERAVHEQTHAARAAVVLRSPLVWAFGALLLVYVGTEIGVGGWTTAYLERTTPIGATAAALVTAGFWLALTGGRVVGALLGSRVPATTLLRWSLAGALLGGVLLALATGRTIPTIAAVLILGASFGPVFPTALSMVTARFRHAPGTAASVVVAMGSGGGMLLPWLQGILLVRSGPAASVFLVAAGTLAMLAIDLARGTLANRQVVASGQPYAEAAKAADC